jgi:hypothetical protein
MCGSTSVACWPGASVYGSELIFVRFAPIGFIVRLEEDDPEQATSTLASAARIPVKKVCVGDEKLCRVIQDFQ